jgi:hypothetical protein
MTAVTVGQRCLTLSRAAAEIHQREDIGEASKDALTADAEKLRRSSAALNSRFILGAFLQPPLRTTGSLLSGYVQNTISIEHL